MFYASCGLMSEGNLEPQRGNYTFCFDDEFGNASSSAAYPPSSVYLNNRSQGMLWRPDGWRKSHYTWDGQHSEYDQSLKAAQPIFGSNLNTTPSLYNWPASNYHPFSLSHTPRPPAGYEESIRLSPSSCAGPVSTRIPSFDLNHVSTSTPPSTVPPHYTIAPTPWNHRFLETLLHLPPQSSPLPCLSRPRVTGGAKARQIQIHSPHRHVRLESPINAGDLVISDFPLERLEPALALVEDHIRPGSRTRRSDVQAKCLTPKPEPLHKQKRTYGNMDVLDVSVSHLRTTQLHC